jgi:hypothetical protein
MPAYIRKVTHACEGTACRREAGYAVYNSANAVIGYFCLAHAKIKLQAFWHDHPDEAPNDAATRAILLRAQS